MEQSNYDNIIFRLLCVFAFLIPYEHVLEVLFGIETVLKPYRVLSLMIIGAYVLKALQFKKIEITSEIKSDIFIYLIFVYGLLVTGIQAFVAPFKLSNFYNDSFQIFLYVSIFFIVKNRSLTREQWNKILWYLTFGIVGNSIYMFYVFYVLQNFERLSGFMDNPNYVAISCVIAISFLILRVEQIKKYKLLVYLTMVFLFWVIVISGSRTSLGIMALILLFSMYFINWRRKIILVGVCLILFTGFLSVSNDNLFAFGGPLIALKRLQDSDAGKDTRFPLWEGAMKATVKNNFVGLGIGQFKTRFGEFYLFENEKLIFEHINRGAAMTIHSDFISILVIYGIFGLICYLIFILKNFLKSVDNLKKAVYLEDKILYQSSILIFSCLVIFGLTADSFTSALFWLTLGLSTKTIQQ